MTALKMNVAFRRALIALSHPISITAIVIVLLNDHWWRRAAPSWLTGKLSDFAWLIFAPFLLTALLAWLPKRWQRNDDRLGQIALIITGLTFTLAKTVPFFNAIAIDFLEYLNGWSNGQRVDPTDLLVLPALGIAWFIWSRSASRTLSSRSSVLLVLAVLTTTGTSPAMYPTGVQQLTEADSILYARDFHSSDGGLTWQEGGGTELQTYGRHYQAWQLTDPSNPLVVYRFTPGVSIERSDDGGSTWRRELDLSGEEARIASLQNSSYMALGPLDAILQRSTGHLIVAMGLEGVVVRLPSGEWRWVTVGSFSVPELKRVDRIVALIENELWLGLALFALIVATLTMRVDLWQMVKTVIVLGLIGVWIAAWFYWIAWWNYGSAAAIFKLLTLGLVALTIWLGAGPRWRRMLLIVAWLALGVWGVSILSLDPYAGAFSMIFGLVLTAISIVIGRRLKRRKRTDTPLIAFLSMVSVALIGCWYFWTYWTRQWTWTYNTELETELSLSFVIATWGLTTLTAIGRPRLKRELWLLAWGAWLIWGIALTIQPGMQAQGLGALALVAISLGVLAIIRKRALLDRVVKVLVMLGWIGWAVTLIVFKPAIPTASFISLEVFSVPMLVTGAVLIGPLQIVVAYRRHRRALASILMLAFGGVVLYLLPYVLWTQGAIPFYASAMVYALALTAATLIAGIFYLQRLNIVAPPEGAADLTASTESGGAA